MSSEMVAAIIANIIAVTALVLHFVTVWRHTIRLRITQLTPKCAFAHKLNYVVDNNFAFFRLRIENLSAVSLSLVELTLIDKNGTFYHPDLYEIQNDINKNGIAYSIMDNANEMCESYAVYDLNNKNILKNTRLSEYDELDCFVTFFDGPILSENQENFTLLVKTIKKSYSVPIVINKLPDNLKLV